MKIIILGTAYPYRGGLSAFNERLAKEFQKEGNDVIIDTFTLQYPNILFPGKTQYSTDEAPKDITIKREVNSINPLNWIKVGMKIKSESPDVLIVKYWLPFMSPCFGTIARLVHQNKKTKIISVLDNIIPHEKRLADKLLSKYWVSSVDGFVAMSQSVLDDLQLFDKTKPRKLCMHPLYDNFGQSKGREEALSALGLDPAYSYILFFGFIRDYKGLDILLEAMADERIRKSNVKVIVAGEFYNNSEKYFELEKRLNIKESVVWKNEFIPDKEVSTFFSAADLIVQPYKSATQSGVTQIAYHFEKPMLVTNVGGLAEIVPNGKVGYVTNPEAKEVADAICDFYDNNRYETFVENVKVEKCKYLWSNMTSAILSLCGDFN